MTTLRKNQFEELIDAMMIEEVAGLDKDIRETLEGLPTEKKRMAILSILDKDRDMFMKIKRMVDDNDVTKAEHIKNVVELVRKYVTVGETDVKNFGEVMTPINELVKPMLDKLDPSVWSNPNLKWLDGSAGIGVFPAVIIERLMDGLSQWEPDQEKRYKHIVENMIYMGELQARNSFLCLCAFDVRDEYELNIFNGSFLSNEFDTHMKEVWGVDKFDICVQNPPYNQMLDTAFLQKSYSISDKILFVHPSTWLLDEKGKQKKFTTTKELVKDHLDSIELFNGNGVFGISLFVPCVITYIDKNKTSKGIHCIDRINGVEITYDNIDDINKFSNTDVYFELKRKIENIVSETGSVWDNMNFNISKPRNNKVNIIKRNKFINENYKFVINLGRIRGHVQNTKKIGTGMDSDMYVNDFYTIIEKGLSVESNVNKHMFLNFNTYGEAENCLNYFKTQFFGFCLSIFKNKSDIDCGELRLVPWLDFTQKWTDEKLYQEFNITQEEIEFINKFIPKYY
jgi:hypothetical protein